MRARAGGDASEDRLPVVLALHLGEVGRELVAGGNNLTACFVTDFDNCLQLCKFEIRRLMARRSSRSRNGF
jgi:hypothetical protein